MDDTPLISVVMPAFNAKKFISEALQSMLEQTYDNFELIVIDDGSTDGTKNIIDRFSINDARIHVTSRENRGLVASLNEGIKKAKGALIARMDADDVATVNRLESQVQFLRQHPSVSIVGGQATVIDETGAAKGELKKPVRPESIEHYLRFGCPIIHPTYLAHRQVFDELGGYRDIKAAEDIDFLVRAFHAGHRFGNLASTILKYRVHSDGMSASNALAQAVSTRLILSRHQKTVARKVNSPEVPLEQFAKICSKDAAGFTRLWKLRNRFLSGPGGAQRLSSKVYAALVSLLNPELGIATYRTWRCKRIVAAEIR